MDCRIKFGNMGFPFQAALASGCVTSVILFRRHRFNHHRLAARCRQYLIQHRDKLAAVARGQPLAVLAAEMEAAAFVKKINFKKSDVKFDEAIAN